VLILGLTNLINASLIRFLLFVEHDAILERLKVLGVDYAQGYGIAKPLPLLENQQSKLGQSTLEASI
jgi:EAL domain-containing protein (putative c-di-GMP-specific phosphodiesterase class I)